MMRIAISGKSGCGNTTVSTMVAERLGYPMINYTFRNMARERGIEFWDFCRMAEEDESIDRELDDHQVALAMAEENCVLGSRLAIWMLKAADVKVYLTASVEERARRIFRREGGDPEKKLAETVSRDAFDSARYARIYGIDNNDASVADLVVDTEDKTPEEVVGIILDHVGRAVQKKADKVK